MASPITCHVLNTMTGTPANGLDATLTFLDKDVGINGVSFNAKTDADGRVKQWNIEDQGSLADVMMELSDGDRTAWSLKFAVGPWYEARGIECFWPEIEVKFYVKKGERHYHVPVLVGPWMYTTYRGS